MRCYVSCLAWLLTSIVCLPALAVYIDEAYHTDYHHALLGVPQEHTTFFHRPSLNSRGSLLYSLSEKGVLGAINPKDGSVVWRQSLTDTESSEIHKGLLRAVVEGDTILSTIGGITQAWDAAEGRLVWEQLGAGESKDMLILDLDGRPRDVLILTVMRDTMGIVRKLGADSGEILWEFKDDSSDTPLGLSSAGNNLYYISSNFAATGVSKINVKTLDPSTGDQSGLITLKIDKESASEGSILHHGAALPLLVWTDRALKVLKVNLIGYEHITNFNIHPYNDERVEHVFMHAPLADGAQAHFLIHYQSKTLHWAEVYHVDISSQSIKKAYDLPPSSGFGAFSASAQGDKVFFTRITESDVKLFSSAQKDELAYWPVRAKTLRGLADSKVAPHAVSEVVSKDASKYAVRSALVLPSGDWELIRNGDHVWLRPESLAGAVAAGFIEPLEERGLADELAMESHSSLSRAYVHRVRRHLKGFIYFSAWTKVFLSRLRGKFTREHSSEAELTTLDGFGFHKIVIIATERGRLIALNTGKHGSVVWNIHLVDLSLGQRLEVMSIESENDIALIRGYDGELWRVRISDGTVVQHQLGGMFDGSKIASSVLDALGEKFLVSVKDDGSLGYYTKSNIKEGTIIVTRGIQGAVRGWNLTPDTDPLMAWEFWPALGEVVTKVVVRPAHDPVASIGKALGDRNVLYKYINPNILFIVTANPEASRATINILDSASGHTLHTATHANVDNRRPIEAIVSENWIAYSLFADVSTPSQDSLETSYPNSKGFQLIISELFKSRFPNDRGPLDASANFSTIYPSPLSGSMTFHSPHVISQAYSVPGPISHISITSTLQGITPRSLLCFLPYQNALISLPRTVLDPRRPVGRDPSPTELEEGLFKHNPLLEFEPKRIISHKREIFSLSGIITSPSLLESTSLVFSYGKVDIFGTRVAPIGEFDMLGKGFSKLQLVGTVIALAIGTGVVAPMVRKKQVDTRWKA